MPKEASWLYEDPFVVAEPKDELIVGRENFPQFATTKWVRSIPVELLETRLDVRLPELKFSEEGIFAEKIILWASFWSRKFPRVYKFNQLTACRGDLQAWVIQRFMHKY